MELGLDIDRRGDWTVLTVSGEVDVATAPSLRRRAAEVLDSGANRLVVDMTPVEFIDSSGLGVLIGVLKRVREADGDLVLVSPHERTMRLFDITGLTEVFEIVSTLDAVET